MTRTVSIDSRFRGPANSGQGGYVSGVAASFLNGPVRVRLRRPSPLDRELTVQTEDDGVAVLDGSAVVLLAKPSQFEIATPFGSEVLASIFERGPQPAPDWHMAPTCFVCGTPDSLGVHPTRLPNIPIWATVWTPDPLHDAAFVANEIVWATLDCPAGWATGDSVREPRSFFPALTDMTAEIVSPVPTGSPVAVVGWLTSDRARRIDCASALITDGGEVLARATLSQAVLPADWAADDAR